MRIYLEDASSYIQRLAKSIVTDPLSLDAWRCLHIQPADPQLVDMKTITAVKQSNPDLDCDVVVCDDGDLLLISRDMDSGLLESAAVALTLGMSYEAPHITSYELFRDWRSIRELLLHKAHGILADKPHLEQADFGEVMMLADMFADAKRIRNIRQPLHVLLVEDDPLTRHVVGNALKKDYALITAGDGAEAIANYLIHAPDIVFLDIGLPDTSGFSVLQRILATDDEAYVVMFSGNSYLDNVTTALAAGASGFIAKPFRKEKLLHYIEDSALRHHKQA